HPDRRRVLITHEFVERGHARRQGLSQLLELRVDAGGEVFVDRDLLFGRWRVGGGYRSGLRGQVVVRPGREFSGVLIAPVLGLVQLFFYRRQLVAQRLCRVDDRLRVGLVFDARGVILRLFADVADGNDRFAGLRELVADLRQQVELLLELFLRGRYARVFLDFEGFGHRFAVDRQFDLIRARHGLRPRGIARPEDHSGEAPGVGIAQIPHEAVQAFFGGRAGRAAGASGTFFIVIAS